MNMLERLLETTDVDAYDVETEQTLLEYACNTGPLAAVFDSTFTLWPSTVRMPGLSSLVRQRYHSPPAALHAPAAAGP